jgi:hypothetical protein
VFGKRRVILQCKTITQLESEREYQSKARWEARACGCGSTRTAVVVQYTPGFHRTPTALVLYCTILATETPRIVFLQDVARATMYGGGALGIYGDHALIPQSNCPWLGHVERGFHVDIP